jgi:hypothetical protein
MYSKPASLTVNITAYQLVLFSFEASTDRTVGSLKAQTALPDEFYSLAFLK